MNDITRPETLAIIGSLTVLCVDDEANILSSLRRRLRPHGYGLLTARSGAEGLSIMERTPVDLVVSDMRMPDMDGAQFLEQVRLRWPDTARVLLTGCADIGSAIAAINKAEIFRYVSKPWNDIDFLQVICDALERKMLERERQLLERMTQDHNRELSELNVKLELEVKERRAELARALEKLGSAAPG